MVSIAVESTAAAAARLAAGRIADLVNRQPAATIGLATGKTMIPIYADLVRRHRIDGLRFDQATIFALDEYLGASPAQPGSCRAFLGRHFLDLVDVDRERVHLLNGQAIDPAAECARYERCLSTVGGLDLQLLGIGANGHIGFNEPGSELDSRTRIVALAASTRAASAREWTSDPVPTHALTMGLATILEARACLLAAFGSHKARAIASTLAGTTATAAWPASVLQSHQTAMFVLDESAASRLGNH